MSESQSIRTAAEADLRIKPGGRHSYLTLRWWIACFFGSSAGIRCVMSHWQKHQILINNRPPISLSHEGNIIVLNTSSFEPVDEDHLSTYISISCPSRPPSLKGCSPKMMLWICFFLCTLQRWAGKVAEMGVLQYRWLLYLDKRISSASSTINAFTWGNSI